MWRHKYILTLCLLAACTKSTESKRTGTPAKSTLATAKTTSSASTEGAGDTVPAEPALDITNNTAMVDTQTSPNSAYTQVDLYDVTTDDIKDLDPTLFSAVVNCKSKASDWVYDPIEGCMQQQTYTAKLHCTAGQWSDLLGCQPTISAQEQRCTAQHLYWVDSTCKRARDLTPDQCTTLNLFPYQNSCFSTEAESTCFQNKMYWFSAASAGSQCLQPSQLPAPLCSLYAPVLAWDTTAKTCKAASSLTLTQVGVQPVVFSPLPLGIKVCLHGELPDAYGTCVPNPDGSFGVPITLGPAIVSANQYVSGPSTTTLITACGDAIPLPTMTYSMSLVYATSCSLKSSYDYMWKQVTFACGSISKTYVNPNYNSTCSNLSTATYAAPGTPSITIAWAWNSYSMFVTNVGPGYNAMLNFGCNQNIGWQYLVGFGSNGEPLCGNYNHYYGMPKCYSFATRNYTDLSCIFDIRTQFAANQLTQTVMAGVADTSTTTRTVCAKNQIQNFYIDNAAQSIGMQCVGSDPVTFGKTTATRTTYSCLTHKEFASFDVFSSSSAIVGYKLHCNDGTTSTIGTTSGTPTTLVCAGSAGLSAYPVGLLVKQQPGQSITQLGLVCGQWNTTQ